MKKTEKERLIDVEMPSDISNAELSAELSAEKSRELRRAVDRQRALENRRAQAEARRASVANARQEYAKVVQEQANARPAEEDSINLKAEEIKAVDKNVARQTCRKGARREASIAGMEERAVRGSHQRLQVLTKYDAVLLAGLRVCAPPLPIPVSTHYTFTCTSPVSCVKLSCDIDMLSRSHVKSNAPACAT